MRSVIITLIIIASSVLAAPVPARAGGLAGVQSYLRQQVAAHKFSGDVLIAVHDRVIFERAYGDANTELGVPNTLHTRFRIFSTTKQFTAAAIMTLAQRGKIDVSAPVSRYLPNFPDGWSAVTVGELLNHSSGIPRLEDAWVNGFLDNAKMFSQYANYAAVEPKFAGSALTNPPGTRWAYNNFGYDLLGAVIERQSGMSLASYMQRAIFDPAGMRNSGLVGRVDDQAPFFDGPRVVANLATGYNGTLGVLGRMQQAMPEQYASAGAGDMYSTVEDLWRYSEALYHGTILSRATQQEMLDDSVPVAGGTMHASCAKCGTTHVVSARNVAWGLGWAVRTVNGHVWMSHSGGENGYSAEFARFPDERATIVVLSNYGFAPVEKMRSVIAGIMFHNKYTKR